MDVRRQQLVAAADALRAWVSAQRATWDNPNLYTTMPAAQAAAAMPVPSEPVLAIAVEPPADTRIVEQEPLGSAVEIRNAIDRIAAILRTAAAWSIGASDAPEIDRINILNATKKAMTRAIETLDIRPDHLLVDALTLPGVEIPQTAITHGDRVCMSIAAASIVAKVVRDRLMDHYDRIYPGFGFAEHKGYGTREHLQAVAQRGTCAIHRTSFKGVWREGVLPFDGDDAGPMIAG